MARQLITSNKDGLVPYGPGGKMNKGEHGEYYVG